MKVFLDMEFTGLHQNTQPISIGLVTEHDRKFYGLFNHTVPQDNPFLLQVSEDSFQFYGLDSVNAKRVDEKTESIANAIIEFLKEYDSITFVTDVGHYDWVLFCELFGGSLRLPKGWNYIPLDLATIFQLCGLDPDTDRKKFADSSYRWKHVSLVDAIEAKMCYEKLMKHQNCPDPKPDLSEEQKQALQNHASEAIPQPKIEHSKAGAPSHVAIDLQDRIKRDMISMNPAQMEGLLVTIAQEMARVRTQRMEEISKEIDALQKDHEEQVNRFVTLIARNKALRNDYERLEEVIEAIHDRT